MLLPIGKIIDISMEISEEMTVYKNREENRPKIDVTRDFNNSDAYETTITIGMHTGTHLDRPLHVIEGGETMDSLNLESAVLPCQVLDLTKVKGGIKREDLEGKMIHRDHFILLKTKNSFEEAFDFSFVYLAESGARYLMERGVKGVGIDALGIERDQPKKTTHKTLLGNDIIILEGLRLSKAEEGNYLLIAAPLKIKSAEAAPVRAMLLEMEEKESRH
jgi:arylformamidase